MRKQFIGLNARAQTAIEYMLLLAAVVSIVLVGFKSYFPTLQLTSNNYFHRVGVGVLGEPNKCGDSVCAGPPIETPEKCPVDC